MGRLVGIFCLEGSQSLACREMKGELGHGSNRC